MSCKLMNRLMEIDGVRELPFHSIEQIKSIICGTHGGVCDKRFLESDKNKSELKMHTKYKNSILTMADGTMICKYCGKKIETVNCTESRSHYYDDEWTEFKCDCEQWKKYIEMNEELATLDYEIYQAFCKYQTKRNDIYSEYKDKYGNLEYHYWWHKLTKNTDLK